MNKLVTALNNNYINKKLRKINKYEINYEDISYQEGIFEVLKKEKIDILLLSEILEGPYEIKELIKKIKLINNNIEIIIILEKKNEKLEKYLIENNINNYFYNNELSFEDFQNKNFKNKNSKKNIEELKKYLIKKKKKIINKKYFKKIREKNVLSVCGRDSMEKSIFCLKMALVLQKKNKKTLIIDFDILNQNINVIFGVKKFPERIKENNKNNTIKLDKNIDIISTIELLIKNNYLDIISKIEKIKNNYDYILINLSSETNMKLSKKIITNSKYCIFLFNEKLKDLQFNKNLIKIYIEEWNIIKEKIICLLNQHNLEENKIIKSIYNDFNVITKLNRSNTIILNKNLKKTILNKVSKSEYSNLIKYLKN